MLDFYYDHQLATMINWRHQWTMTEAIIENQSSHYGHRHIDNVIEDVNAMGN